MAAEFFNPQQQRGDAIEAQEMLRKSKRSLLDPSELIMAFQGPLKATYLASLPSRLLPKFGKLSILSVLHDLKYSKKLLLRSCSVSP